MIRPVAVLDRPVARSCSVVPLEAARTETHPMTVREHDVLELLARGWSNRTIADLLAVNDKTVETHISHVFQKLGLLADGTHHRRVVAALWWNGFDR